MWSSATVTIVVSTTSIKVGIITLNAIIHLFALTVMFALINCRLINCRCYQRLL
ncbi:hypothetical protein MCHI_003743 [Candidatus Magnetoovum chiemensis]|nr:hypothetical protein MCHI_003743 [Candidatus Magnetoovum chiemensis]